MAGQSPEHSFEPSEQDAGLTQGRTAWQVTPGYTPPGGSGVGANAGGAQAYAAPASSYPPPDQAYPAQDPTYTVFGQSPNQGYQGGYQQGYQGPPAPPPQWQAAPGNRQGAVRPKAPGEKGFVGSLFDFSFNSFVTPKIVKVLYVLVTLWTALLALVVLVIGFKTGGMAGGLFTLIIIEPIFVLLTLGIYRVVLEAFMVVFRIYEETKKLRENSENRG